MRLFILRHAKSSWDNASLSDHERPLNDRGRKAAARMGRLLGRAQIDLVLCSSAERTRETLSLLALGDVRTEIDDDLYGASAGDLMARLWEVGPTDGVLVIGHNPGVQDLAISLVGDSQGLEHFPTAALAELSLPIAAWDDLQPGVASLVRFVTPHDV